MLWVEVVLFVKFIIAAEEKLTHSNFEFSQCKKPFIPSNIAGALRVTLHCIPFACFSSTIPLSFLLPLNCHFSCAASQMSNIYNPLLLLLLLVISSKIQHSFSKYLLCCYVCVSLPQTGCMDISGMPLIVPILGSATLSTLSSSL